jgi:hypothetical protein
MRLSRSARNGIGLAVAVLSVAVLIGLVFLPKASVIRSDLRAEIKAWPMASHILGPVPGSRVPATGRG